MPRPPWGPRDRLEAPDLNAAFSAVAQGRMPAALCPAGPDVSLPQNVATEMPLAQPAPGDDPAGYWQSTGRLVIPKGLGGLHLLVVGLAGLRDAPKGNTLRLTINGWAGASGLVFGVSATGAAGVESGRVFPFAGTLAELTAVWITVAADSAGPAHLTMARIVRLASFGVYV